MAQPQSASTAAKNSAASATMIATITEVIQVSRRLVQVIRRASARTSRANWARLTRFFGSGVATAPGVAMTAAVRAARFLIACGDFPGFLAMAAFFKLSNLGGGGRPRPGQTRVLI